MIGLLATAAAAAPPLELVGLPQTPTPAGPMCELLLYLHDDERPDRTWRLLVSAPDAAGRSWVYRVTLGLPQPGTFPDTPVRTVHEVDARQPFVDPRVEDADGRHHFTFVRPSAIDWSTWPLEIPFVGPRLDRPEALGAYTLRTRPGASRDAWGSCILTLEGPGIPSGGACTVLEEPSTDCLRRYEARHTLPSSR